jgi:hypothetical protein
VWLCEFRKTREVRIDRRVLVAKQGPQALSNFGLSVSLDAKRVCRLPFLFGYASCARFSHMKPQWDRNSSSYFR